MSGGRSALGAVAAAVGDRARACSTGLLASMEEEGPAVVDVDDDAASDAAPDAESERGRSTFQLEALPVSASGMPNTSLRCLQPPETSEYACTHVCLCVCVCLFVFVCARACACMCACFHS